MLETTSARPTTLANADGVNEENQPTGDEAVEIGIGR